MLAATRSLAALSRGAARSFHRSAASNLLIRTLDDVNESGDVTYASTGTWESRRYLKREHGFGFSMHHTILYAGKSTLIHYKNHVEAVMITQGGGEIEVVTGDQTEGEGQVHTLNVGDMYLLNDHDKHFLRALPNEDMHVVCAFNPPIVGIEDHDDDGVYPAVDCDGNQYHTYGPEALPALFKPPTSLAEGSHPVHAVWKKE